VRQIFSVRFFAAVGAVAGLLFLLFTIFTARGVIDEAIDDDGAGAADVQSRGIDLVDVITASSNPGFQVSADGVASADTQFTLDPSRKVTIVAGTPGEDHCGRSAEPGVCAVVADLLGEGVVWFALVPMGNGRSVPLPAIDTLDGGFATLVNGWQLPHVPALDRRCGEDELFESYRQFKQILGENFTAIYDIDQRQLTAVVCRQVVPYAPPAESTTTSTTTV
jgi:hypothetical protein